MLLRFLENAPLEMRREIFKHLCARDLAGLKASRDLYQWVYSEPIHLFYTSALIYAAYTPALAFSALFEFGMFNLGHVDKSNVEKRAAALASGLGVADGMSQVFICPDKVISLKHTLSREVIESLLQSPDGCINFVFAKKKESSYVYCTAKCYIFYNFPKIHSFYEFIRCKKYSRLALTQLLIKKNEREIIAVDGAVVYVFRIGSYSKFNFDYIHPKINIIHAQRVSGNTGLAISSNLGCFIYREKTGKIKFIKM